MFMGENSKMDDKNIMETIEKLQQKDKKEEKEFLERIMKD